MCTVKKKVKAKLFAHLALYLSVINLRTSVSVSLGGVD